MTAINQNFELFDGDSKVIRISVTDPPVRVGRNLVYKPADITGSSAKWAMRLKGATINALYKDTSTGGIVFTDPTAGVFEVTLTSEETDDILAAYYDHEAVLIDALGNESTVMTGTIKVKKRAIERT